MFFPLSGMFIFLQCACLFFFVKVGIEKMSVMVSPPFF